MRLRPIPFIYVFFLLSLGMMLLPFFVPNIHWGRRFGIQGNPMVAKYGYFVIGTACVVLGAYGSVRRILRVRRVRARIKGRQKFSS